MDDYVRALRLYHSMGIGLSDQENCIRSIIVLDRMQDVPFTYQEIKLVRIIQPLLENYHIDLLLEAGSASSPLQSFKQAYFLTKRETEIVGLLTDGLTPTLISKRISVSVTTVYRHVANIYQKGFSLHSALFSSAILGFVEFRLHRILHHAQWRDNFPTQLRRNNSYSFILASADRCIDLPSSSHILL